MSDTDSAEIVRKDEGARIAPEKESAGIAKTLETLGVGLSRLLRYSYGGFLLVTLAAVLNPSDAKPTLDAMGWQLVALSAVVLGAGIYVVHRSLVTPLHHALLCLIFFGFEKLRKPQIDAGDSSSPTRWLGSRGIPRGQRMLAYSALRRSDFFPEQKKNDLNVAHAEIHLVVMIAEGLIAGAVYASLYKSNIGWVPLLIVAFLFLGTSFPGPFVLHSLECRDFRSREDCVQTKLRQLGFDFTSRNSNRGGSNG